MSHVGLQVYSEIGKLKKVLLHRPGEEIENLTPDLMERLLFDDIPFLEVARQEHDAFANVFRQKGADVVYLEDLMAETLDESGLKLNFIDVYFKEAGINSTYQLAALKEYFLACDSNRKMVDKMMAGIRREELKLGNGKTLSDQVGAQYPFLIDPMPNLYFTRDPFATIGNGVSMNRMRTVTRRRETLFADTILRYHKDFVGLDIPFYYNRDEAFDIEGGDILVLSEKVIAVGISQRTDADAIETFAKRVFNDTTSFETVLAFDIPKIRAFMHLDTVFTMVDYSIFTIHPEIEGPLTVFSIKKTGSGIGYTIEKELETLDVILAKYLDIPKVQLIRCGGKAGIDAGREQWNDGSNTLAIAPGEVIVYARNHVTNRLLEDAGVKLHAIPSSELSRGRGGPRCMSMPLIRTL